MADSVETVLASVIGQSLQDARALSVRAQDSAAKAHDLIWTNALGFQHQVQQAALADTATAAGYRGSHYKKGSEVDGQESIAEGVAYKGEAAASYPATQELLGNSLAGLEAKLAGLTALVQQIMKGAQSTPPETAVRP